MRIAESLLHLFGSIASGDTRYIYYDGKESYFQPFRTTMFYHTGYGLRRGFLDANSLQHNIEVLHTIRTYENKNSIINIITGHKKHWLVRIQLDGHLVYSSKISFTTSSWIRTLAGRIIFKLK